MEEQNTNIDNFSNVLGSSAIASIVTFIIKYIFPWTMHTVGAVLTALIMAGAVFFFNRFLHKNFKS